jgi:hypothetical protein
MPVGTYLYLHVVGIAEAIVNALIPPGVASFLASATLIPLDKLDPEQRRAQEQELRDQTGTLRMIGIGSEFNVEYMSTCC